uniref:ADOR14 n=1 Tax=Adoxophyes orana granulovirus TaxID=170617 RepID=A0A0A0VGC8_GVAO|nr:hypothetical protein [Adoxophyes orana granulovirus]AJA91654.1 ADOR14 [Adoxophyes orana granulovirus]
MQQFIIDIQNNQIPVIVKDNKKYTAFIETQNLFALNSCASNLVSSNELLGDGNNNKYIDNVELILYLEKNNVCFNEYWPLFAIIDNVIKQRYQEPILQIIKDDVAIIKKYVTVAPK